jgi:glyoxylase-like metal-dependent hydrolase (beta-lactamase superfamily II)
VRSILLTALLISTSWLAPLNAQAAPQPPTHHVEKLSDHAYAILGPGGNVGLFVTEHAAVLIDSQFEKSAPGLLEAVRTVTKNPIKYLIDTHHHPDHVGANAFFASQGAIIVAHTNVRKRMLAQDPKRTEGLPELSIGEEDGTKLSRLDLHLEGLELHVVHYGLGHTDNDLAIGSPADRVLHMGDLFFHGSLPFIDTGAGGSLEGLLAEFEWLCTWVPEDVKIIPGHGPICGKKDLQRHRDFLKALLTHAKANAAMSPKELADSFDTKAWSDYKPTGSFVTWETLFGAASGKGAGRVQK